jgi:hypothetical protein
MSRRESSRQAGVQLPAEVSNARDRLDTQATAATFAMQNHDNDQLAKRLQPPEDSVAVIRKYLKQ